MPLSSSVLFSAAAACSAPLVLEEDAPRLASVSLCQLLRNLPPNETASASSGTGSLLLSCPRSIPRMYCFGSGFDRITMVTNWKLLPCLFYFMKISSLVTSCQCRYVIVGPTSYFVNNADCRPSKYHCACKNCFYH